MSNLRVFEVELKRVNKEIDDLIELLKIRDSLGNIFLLENKRVRKRFLQDLLMGKV
jgi:hypothetical protein